MKKFILATLGFLAISYAQAQQASIYSTNNGALNGYDVVAFHTDSAAVKGSKMFSTQWQNATWYFTTEEHLQAFTKNPEKFVPEYGGYCAYGVSDNHKAPTEANTFTLINNKLYFNYNNKVKQIWQKNTPTLIETANKNWPTLQHKN